MPTMDRTTLREALYTAIALTLQRSGRQKPTFRDSDKPISGYEGFDSQCGVEVTLELEQLLGIDDLGTNVFVKGTGSTAQARTIAEMVEHLFRQLNNGDRP